MFQPDTWIAGIFAAIAISLFFGMWTFAIIAIKDIKQEGRGWSPHTAGILGTLAVLSLFNFYVLVLTAGLLGWEYPF